MRQILRGPFGSMGVMNMKMRNICVEDMFLEGLLLVIAIIRIITADTSYELLGAYGALLGAGCITITLSILVLDGGIQCLCCKQKPCCTYLCFCGRSTEIISDKTLLKVFLRVTQLGIAMAVMTIITECFTFGDEAESKRSVVKLPDNINDYGIHKYVERDNAIVIIVVQVVLSIPWRLYVYRVTKGVLDAVHCVEVLQFRSVYSGDALRRILPDTGLVFGVDLAHESDIPTLAKLYCESFADLFSYIGLPSGAGPDIIEAHWRSHGRITLTRWLGRVGVVRDETGVVIGALSLQLPGDTAAYASLQSSTSTDYYNPLDSSSVSVYSSAPGGASATDLALPMESLDSPSEEDTPTCSPEFHELGIFNALRFRYKHAILNDHVCTPGEAYVDFLAVKESEHGEGVGTRLMKWAEQSAEKLGCGRITLSVWGMKQKTQAFYENLGFEQIDQTDAISYVILQIIFCFRDRFYDFEKALGQEQGRAIHASKYGFTSELLSEKEGSSGHGSGLMSSVHGLLSGVGNLTIGRGFVLGNRKNGRSSPRPRSDRHGRLSDSEAGGLPRASLGLSSHGLLSSNYDESENGSTCSTEISSVGLGNRGVNSRNNPKSSSVNEADSGLSTSSMSLQHTKERDPGVKIKSKTVKFADSSPSNTWRVADVPSGTPGKLVVMEPNGKYVPQNVDLVVGGTLDTNASNSNRTSNSVSKLSSNDDSSEDISSLNSTLDSEKPIATTKFVMIHDTTVSSSSESVPASTTHSSPSPSTYSKS